MGRTPYLSKTEYDKKQSLVINYKYYSNLNNGITELSVNQTIEKIKNMVYSRLNIPERYKDCSFENYEPEKNREVFQRIKKITNMGFSEQDKPTQSLYLWGKGVYGVGKTHLLYAMIKEYSMSDDNIQVFMQGGIVYVEYTGKSICALSEYEFLNKIKNTYKPESELNEGDIYERLNKYNILCLDDVVKYTPMNPDFYQRVMFQLVDERYKNKLALFITTNKSLHDLAEYIGYATADRIYEMTKDWQLEFKGETHRVK
jgi:DNA replication protein DnaC